MKNRIKSTLLLAIMLLVSISVQSQTVIQMEKDGGVYKIPCEINGLRLKLIFDTGASNVCISESIALMMLENGYLEKADIRGSGSAVVADGRIVDNTKINIKALKIGDETLNNVEAVVIHQQTAPLLLGQSAIQKLGKISISGNLLIINGTENINNTHATSGMSSIAYEEVLAKAKKAYYNKLYELAVSYYDKCYGYTSLDESAQLLYANSLFEIGKYNRALDLYNELKQHSDSYGIEAQMALLYRIADCYFRIGDYSSCILIGQDALLQCGYDNTTVNKPNSVRYCLISTIACAYKKKDGVLRAKYFILDEVKRYLFNNNMIATDCWNKGYKNYYVAELYTCLAMQIITADDFNESKKYVIIAAAWGDEIAIEGCNYYSWSYQRKPSEYNY